MIVKIDTLKQYDPMNCLSYIICEMRKLVVLVLFQCCAFSVSSQIKC